MRTLLLMRHAKSDWKQAGLADHDRPLNTRGRRAAPVMARQLHDQGVKVDVILASTAERARKTVALMQKEWAAQTEVLHSKSLYLASPQQILSELKSLNDSWSSVLVVAHNPGLAELVSYLAGSSVEMPTAAVAIFECAAQSWNSDFAPACCRLKAHWKPRDLMADDAESNASSK